MKAAKIEDALADIRRGRMLIVCDSMDRENEGDLVVAAQKATAASVNFMIKEGGGLICVALPRESATHLGLSPMVAAEDNATPYGCDFTVSVDARRGITTGISAADRAATIRLLASPSARSYDLVRPGHIFPVRARTGGVLVRAGHTEAAVDLARLAGLHPVAAICEILDKDGKAARAESLGRLARKHRLKVITIDQLIEYRRAKEQLVKRWPRPSCRRNTAFIAHVYDCPSQNIQHVA